MANPKGSRKRGHHSSSDREEHQQTDAEVDADTDAGAGDDSSKPNALKHRREGIA